MRKIIKKIFLICVILISANFLLQSIVRYSNGYFSLNQLLQVVLFFGFCFFVSLLELFNKIELSLKGKKDIPKMFIFSIFLACISLYLIFLDEVIIKIFGFGCLVYTVVITFRKFKNLKR